MADQKAKDQLLKKVGNWFDRKSRELNKSEFHSAELKLVLTSSGWDPDNTFHVDVQIIEKVHSDFSGPTDEKEPKKRK